MKADGELRAGTAQVWVAPGGRSRAREGNPGGQLVGGGVDSSEGVFALRGPFRMCGARSLLS